MSWDPLFCLIGLISELSLGSSWKQINMLNFKYFHIFIERESGTDPSKSYIFVS